MGGTRPRSRFMGGMTRPSITSANSGGVLLVLMSVSNGWIRKRVSSSGSRIERPQHRNVPRHLPLRATNVIESSFATVRHRTERSKGCLSDKTALAMIFKLAEAAEKSWRRLDGHN